MRSDTLTDPAAPRALSTSSPDASLDALVRWVEARDYTGYDLYDGLNVTKSKALLHSPLANTGLTQFFKHSPVNLRPLLGLPETKMPKGVGLFLNAYAHLAERAGRAGDAEQQEAYLQRCAPLVAWLNRHACPGHAGYGWNFGFPYKFLFDNPTVVITAIIGRGLFAHYELTRDEAVREMLEGITRFILQDLYITETDYGISFSYTPKSDARRTPMQNCCYNASMLGAEILAKVYAVTGDERLRDYARRAVDFTVRHQHADGRWNYSIDLTTGRERPQVDFHQGFILDSLEACMRYGELTDPRYAEALERGAAFYRRAQFFDDGRGLWRWPRPWPSDIHGQAQGILTFTRLRHLDPAYGPFAARIAAWTIDHMQDPEGYFYYRKGRYFTNRIPYMRWGQGWMMLALAELLNHCPAPPAEC